jgi:hypothetical protein
VSAALPPLTEHGTGSVTLVSGTESWFVEDLHYDFTAGPPLDPTLSLSPEPATLLVSSIGAAGPGLTQWRRRRKRHAASGSFEIR